MRTAPRATSVALFPDQSRFCKHDLIDSRLYPGVDDVDAVANARIWPRESILNLRIEIGTIIKTTDTENLL